MRWWLIGLGSAALIAFLYWQLIIAEGAYLGRHVVVWLYNISAHVYDRIKQYDSGYEKWLLGTPLSRALSLLPDPLVLDVATGTGRLARTLFREPGFHGRMIGLDYSRKMLREAARTTAPWEDRLTYIWQDAGTLPFPDATFDAVSCLEALEFMPQPEAALAEILRVLHPGGVLLLSNRIGKDTRFLIGRTYTPQAFEKLLHRFPLEMIRTQSWQENYDLIWAVKSGVSGSTPQRRLETILRCPQCQAPLERQTNAFFCRQNGHRFPIAADGVIEMTH